MTKVAQHWKRAILPAVKQTKTADVFQRSK